MHNPAEEECFYKPLIRKIGDLGLVIKEGENEHGNVMKLIEQYELMSEKSKERKILLSFIKKSLEGHIDKEENEVFKLAKEHLDKDEASEMEKNFQIAKEKIKNKFGNN